MNLLTLVLLAITAAVVIAFAAHALTVLLRNDGYGLRFGQHTPPRSHEPDLFDPRSGIA